ncbi:MAG: hypothetical protein CMP05_03600 [Xanthomarina sp.]|nr:hypothetical protein [Xanthomarina sp.]HAB28998.1 hypothetical protein [Xanthomarina gelatinilytica]HAI19679.1 hypothetical protein [Xanthomarina gelatinilytica]
MTLLKFDFNLFENPFLLFIFGILLLLYSLYDYNKNYKDSSLVRQMSIVGYFFIGIFCIILGIGLYLK